MLLYDTNMMYMYQSTPVGSTQTATEVIVSPSRDNRDRHHNQSATPQPNAKVTQATISAMQTPVYGITLPLLYGAMFQWNL